MEKTASAILNYRGTEWDLARFKDSVKERLEIWEIEIYKSRLRGKGIFEVDETDFIILLRGSVVDICSICGVECPGTPSLANSLTKQLTFFLKTFSPKNLNFEEVVLAFQLNLVSQKTLQGHLIEKIICDKPVFCVDYFSAVLNNYFLLRKQFERKIENFIDRF